jgi:hypothetical protein
MFGTMTRNKFNEAINETTGNVLFLRRVGLVVVVCSLEYSLLTGFHLAKYAALPAVAVEMKQQEQQVSSSHPAATPTRRFDPFTDLQLTTSTTFAYSQHRCVEQPASDLPAFVGRTCMFTNLYFEPSSGKFHYYVSPTEEGLEDFSELTTATGYIHRDQLTKTHGIKNLEFRPIVHFNNETVQAPATVTVVAAPSSLSFFNKYPVFLLYKLSYDFNFGHFVFDDLLSLFAMMDIFGLLQDATKQHQHVPMFLDKHADPFYRCSPARRWTKCMKSMKRFVPDLLGMQINNDRVFSVSNAFANNVSDNKLAPALVRLPTAVVGAGRLAHYSCQGDCTIHRNVYRARQWIFQNVFGPNETHSLQPVTVPLITMVLPVGNSHPGVEWFESIAPAVQAQFPHPGMVQLVDMATLTVPEQLLLASRSAVYITNHGGGSATSLFLQSGSTVLLFADKKTREDDDLYDSLGYLHCEWLLANQTEPEVVIRQVKRALDRLGFIV